MLLNKEQIYRLKNECNVDFINSKKIEEILKNYTYLDKGSFAFCYTNNSGLVLKKYFSNPHLDSSENGNIVYSYKDVIDNLIYIQSIRQENSAIPIKFYVCNNHLLMYKAPFMPGEKLEAISYLKKDKNLIDIKNAWLFGYYLAEFYANYKISMYDLNPDNCSIYNDMLNIYDVDFYKKENDERFILLNNYEIINDCFANFFERYYFNYCYETRLKNFYSNKFCDDFFMELNDNTTKKCKTLKDVELYLK